MSFSYNPATNVGKVRLNIGDTDSSTAIFDDDAEIQAFLDQRSDDVSLASALALRSIAASRARLERKIKVLDIDIDTRTMAKELREQAESIEKSVDEGGGFAIVEMVPTSFAYAERVEKERQRSGT